MSFAIIFAAKELSLTLLLRSVFNGGAKWLDDELRTVHDGFPLIERYPGGLGEEVQEGVLPLFPFSSVQVDEFHTGIKLFQVPI